MVFDSFFLMYICCVSYLQMQYFSIAYVEHDSKDCVFTSVYWLWLQSANKFTRTIGDTVSRVQTSEFSSKNSSWVGVRAAEKWWFFKEYFLFWWGIFSLLTFYMLINKIASLGGRKFHMLSTQHNCMLKKQLQIA